MIPGIEPGSRQAKAVKDWMEAQLISAQSIVNDKGTLDSETQYQRGRLHLAAAFIEALKPDEPAPKAERKPRDGSGY